MMMMMPVLPDFGEHKTCIHLQTNNPHTVRAYVVILFIRNLLTVCKLRWNSRTCVLLFAPGLRHKKTHTHTDTSIIAHLRAEHLTKTLT